MSDKIRRSLYLPPDLHEQLKRLAEQESRSVNAQITHILQLYIDQYLNSPLRQRPGRGEGDD